MSFLYEDYNTADSFIDFKELVPDYIKENLKYDLRPYQEEAVGRYLYYYYRDNTNKILPEHLLYNMATGSGKTLLMAAILLEKYKQGERNFIFFVNNDNILTKTRSNFLEGGGSKYLFADKIVIDHQVVTIREVTDFSDSQSDSINIVFTTIQKLHTDLNNPRENRLSYDQFEDISVVLIADEAHHLNAGLGKAEKDENTTWTATVDNIQRSAKRSSLFEFTATIDLSNPDLAKKYEKHLLFKYDLKEFRLDKYSKDVLFHLVDSDIRTRMIQAIIISQYRKKIALKNDIFLKPLVMFKSKKIQDSKNNLTEFLNILESLDENTIEEQRKHTKKGILSEAFDYFSQNSISNYDLAEELREDFREERLLLVDGKNKSSDSLNKLNTLEQPTNEIRAIFAVDMLNEGWDVLNLFDIVRLYDTRDGRATRNGYVAGTTTNAEKQLIGRGARYYPFVVNGNLDDKYTRKFDDNEFNELRVLEQLHYHSANNPSYISELKQVLRESGIYDDETLVERELQLKPSFMKTRTYQKGHVWVNDRIPYTVWLRDSKAVSLSDKIIPSEFEIELPTLQSSDISAFENEETTMSQSLSTRSSKLGKCIEQNIIRYAINRNPNYTFDRLQKVFLGLTSLSGFIKELENIDLVIKGDETAINSLSQDNKVFIMDKLLADMEKDLVETEERFIGSDKFIAKPIKDVFKPAILRKYTMDRASGAEFGISQKEVKQELL